LIVRFYHNSRPLAYILATDQLILGASCQARNWGCGIETDGGIGGMIGYCGCAAAGFGVVAAVALDLVTKQTRRMDG
jgi:hypothetical protein